MLMMRPHLRALLAVLLLAGVSSCAGVAQPVAPPTLPIGNAVVPAQTVLARHTAAMQALKAMAAGADSVAVARFDPPCFECRRSPVPVDDVLRGVKPVAVTAAKLTALRSFLADELALVPPSVPAAPCVPVAADAALVFRQGSTRGMLLLYAQCRAVRVVADDAPGVYFISLGERYGRLEDLAYSTSFTR